MDIWVSAPIQKRKTVIKYGKRKYFFEWMQHMLLTE